MIVQSIIDIMAADEKFQYFLPCTLCTIRVCTNIYSRTKLRIGLKLPDDVEAEHQVSKPSLVP
jgi:hypothetical protein